MYAEYDDSEIGALEGEEIDGNCDPDMDLLLRHVEKFKNEQKQQVNSKFSTFQTIFNNYNYFFINNFVLETIKLLLINDLKYHKSNTIYFS